MINTYFVEMTDTYSGEANYSWVNRFKVKASTKRGAMLKVSREVGTQRRLKKDYDTGDLVRYNVSGACICFFVQHWEETDEQYFNVKEL